MCIFEHTHFTAEYHQPDKLSFATEPNTIHLVETVIYIFFNKFSCSNDARVYEKQMVCCVLCDIYYSW